MPPETDRIDLRSHVPYYLQLIDLLKGKIKRKAWQPGEQIPGEPDLCAEYGISRTVVRQALRELELEGLILRKKGKGTFVAEPKISESLAQKLTGFYQDMVERGLNPVTRVLRQEVQPASEKVSKHLQIPAGTPVIDIERLRFIDDVPIQLVTTYIPYSMCPHLMEIDLTNRSLYEFLEKECGLFIARGRRFIEAVTATDTEARLLKVDRGAPPVMLDSISFLESGTPIE